jgi:peptidyl-tRNA hydrolase, PTH1 family
MGLLPIFLIVGLGNPGSKYELTRHNIGFRIIEKISEKFQSSFQKEKKYEIAKYSDGNKTIYLLKPMEFMNLSGSSVQAILSKFKISIQNTLVFHDEIDFPFGKIKRKSNGGHAGHNGLRDIIEKTASSEFSRIRFGVGKPNHPDFEVSDYVLSKFFKEEEEKIPDLIHSSIQLMEEWLKERTIINSKEQTL